MIAAPRFGVLILLLLFLILIFLILLFILILILPGRPSGRRKSRPHATTQRRDEFGSGGGMAGFGEVAARASGTIAPDPFSAPSS